MTATEKLEAWADAMEAKRAVEADTDESDLTDAEFWPPIAGDAFILAEALEISGGLMSMAKNTAAIDRLLRSYRKQR